MRAVSSEVARQTRFHDRFGEERREGQGGGALSDRQEGRDKGHAYRGQPGKLEARFATFLLRSQGKKAMLKAAAGRTRCPGRQNRFQ